MLLQVLLRALAQSSSPLLTRLTPQAGALPRLPRRPHRSQEALVSCLSHPGAGHAGKPGAGPCPLTMVPWPRAERLSHSTPALQCSPRSAALRAWHGTYRASATSAKAPPPEHQQTGWLIRPCSPEPWPASWGSSEPYCTSFVSSSCATTHFPLKTKNSGEGLEAWGVETGALLPTFLPPAGPQQSHPR